jgi:hypothetical protein
MRYLLRSTAVVAIFSGLPALAAAQALRVPYVSLSPTAGIKQIYNEPAKK